MPYLLNKCQKYRLSYSFDNISSVDLYKLLAPFRKQFKLPDMKQKTLEGFLGFKRDDILSGKELISKYSEYQKSGDQSLLDIILLHNHDDLLGMMRLLPALSYIHIFRGKFKVEKCTISEYTASSGEQAKEAVFTLKFNTAVPKPISTGNTQYYVTFDNNTGKVRIKIYSDELKYFFPNYQDYYYLPTEDTAIHKSVSFYVDKNFRTQAKAATCYSRKTGHFLPQLSNVITPFFKKDYNDKLTYFEMTDEFMNDNAKQALYVKSVLECIVSNPSVLTTK